MGKTKKPTVINIYPQTKKPEWLELGSKCHCLGEASDVFTVYDISYETSSSMLLTSDGYAHGRESWSKLSAYKGK